MIIYKLPKLVISLLVGIIVVLNINSFNSNSNNYVQSLEYKTKINVEEYRNQLFKTGGISDIDLKYESEQESAISYPLTLADHQKPLSNDDTKSYNMTYVDSYWSGGTYIPCPFLNCTVNATSYACSPDGTVGRGNWNDGKTSFNDPLPPDSTLKAVGFELYGTFNCDSTDNEKSQLLILLQDEEVGPIFTINSESICACANCYSNVSIPVSQVAMPLYNYSNTNMLSINVLKNGICLFKVRTFLYYTLNPPPTSTTGSLTTAASTSTGGSGGSTTGGGSGTSGDTTSGGGSGGDGTTTSVTTTGSTTTTGGGNNTPTKGGLTTKQWAIIASTVTGGALAFILVFVYVRQKIARVGYVEIREGKTIDIGEIKLGERIGKGNFGEVYKGFWRGAVVAIKKLPAHNITDTVMKEFHREIELMKNLRHPNVIQFLGSCTIPPNICICTEYMPKGSLYGILHDPSIVLQWSLIKKMCLDAAKGIIYLHSSIPVILHRDLKSHNLLVDENFKVKVADFGLSTIEQTATMTACGTPCWTAPEVLRNQRYTEKADVYSFGIVMWECATRCDPYSGMPPFQVIFAVGREGLRPPVPRNCPPDFVSLVTDCWSENADGRPSMEMVLSRLEALDVTGWPDVIIR